MSDLEALRANARTLLPPGVAIAATDPLSNWPDDPDGPANAVERRRREFAAGRAAVRIAMQSLGCAPARIPAGADRAPIWPDGLTGSITHSRRACLAAVARRNEIASVGIDLADDTPLAENLWDVICRPAELAWLDKLPEAARGVQAMAIFSAKEAAYKAQYPQTQTLFGFQGMEVAASGSGFTATFCAPVGRFRAGNQLNGQWARVAGHIISAVVLPLNG